MPDPNARNAGALGTISTRRIIPARFAILQIGQETYRQEVSPEAKGAVFQVTLSKGKTILQGWFQNAAGEDLCGAFYVSVLRESSKK